MKRVIQCLLAGLLLTGTALADLTAAQQKALADAQAAYNQFATNFNLALQSAGNGTPKGSKAKLAMVRLNSAKQHLPKVTSLLAQLPADDAQVQAFQKTFDAAQESVKQLEARLTGQPAPAPQPSGGDSTGGGEPTPTPPPTPTGGGEKKLDYRQEEAFRKARFSLNQVVGIAGSLKEFSGNVEKVEDVTTLDHRLMAQGMNTVAEGRKRIGEFKTHFDGLPADGRGIAQAQAQFDAAVAEIDKAEKILAPRWATLSKLIDPAQYPELGADYDRIRELSSMFGNPTIFQTDYKQAAGLVEQMAPARKEADRILAAYAVMVRQKTDMGQKLMKQYDYFGRQLQTFEQAAAQHKAGLPDQINKHLGEARKYATEAVEKQKPLFFTGGIPQQIGFATDKLELLQALDPPAAKALQDQIDKFQVELKQQQESLREQIIAGNNVPPDRYGGADRKALIERATAAWKKRDASATVLGACIPSEAWKREVLWRSQNTGSWYKIDRSRIQVQLLVADKNENLAVIQPVNLWKDHLSNDSMTATLFHAEDYELLPQSYLLRAKIK